MVVETTFKPRCAIVIGAGDGLGYPVALKLARRGFKVMLCGRSLPRVDRAMKLMHNSSPGQKLMLEVRELDLSEMGSIQDLVTDVKRRKLKVCVLVNAAAVWCPAYGSVTRSGLEVALAVNYLGHYQLVNLLMPVLESSRPSRIITVSCEEYSKVAAIDFPFLEAEHDKLDTQGVLRLTVESAAALASVSTHGASNPCVRVTVQEEAFETAVKKRTTQPTWNETFQVHDIAVEKSIHFSVISREANGVEKFIGQASLPLLCLASGGYTSPNISLQFNLPLVPEKAAGSVDKSKAAILSAQLLNGDSDLLKRLDIHDISQFRASRLQHAEALAKEYLATGGTAVEMEGSIIIFAVTKRLNMFKTSKRKIVVDIGVEELRNTTVNDRIRKKFPFAKLMSIATDPATPTLATVVFSHRRGQGDSLQRDYSLNFSTTKQRDLFRTLMVPYLVSTTTFERGLVAFCVIKKLNRFETGVRKLVLDIRQRKLLSIELEDYDQFSKDRFAQINKKEFNFNQIRNILEDSEDPEKVEINFEGGQRAYTVVFLLEELKVNFLQTIDPFLQQHGKGILRVRLMYTRPPAASTNNYVHEIEVAGKVKTEGGVMVPWAHTADLLVPEAPEFMKRDWDTSQAMVTRSEIGLQRPPRQPLWASRHSKLCLITFATALAQKLEARGSGVCSHIIDPGLMDTDMWGSACKGLGAWRKMLQKWRVDTYGKDPDKVADTIIKMVFDPEFETHNGLYVRHGGTGANQMTICNLDTASGTKIENPSHPNAVARSPANQARLWHFSTMMTSVTFDDQVYSAFLNLR
mmetsp:Transcript_51116/g.121122  ORF Transcript_51116/g.121122 Transcript_51116/m.121122 type:complete len:804 (+) Transcript_51116:79-2490(+)